MRLPRRVRSAAQLLFPAVVAVGLAAPVLVPGALAFDIQRDFSLRPAEIGAIVTVYYLLSSVAAFSAMPLATRFAPMTMARVGLLLCAGSALGAGLVGSKVALVAMCVVSGIANGLATPSANVLIALTIPSRRRGLAFGLRMSAVPAAAAFIGIGAYVIAHSSIGWRAIVTAIGLVCVGLLAASFAGRSVRVQQPRQTPEEARGDGLATLRLLALGGLLAATACSTLVPFLVEGLIAGGAAPADAALLLGASAWIGVAARVSAGLVADRVPNPHGHLTGASVMLLAAACGMTALALGRGMPVLATATLVTFGIGWAWPGLLHHATVALYPGHMTRATTYLQLGTFIGAVLGPLGFGWIVERGSYGIAFMVTAAMATLGAAAMAIGNRFERGRAVG